MPCGGLWGAFSSNGVAGRGSPAVPFVGPLCGAAAPARTVAGASNTRNFYVGAYR